MAKSREETQQLGFWDSDISNPNHDEICLWAYENADLIVQKAFPTLFNREWIDDEFRPHDIAKNQEAKKIASENARPNPKISKKIIECVLKSYTGYMDRVEKIVGYADLIIEVETPFIYAEYAEHSSAVESFKVDWQTKSILVEVKSVLPTLGELMRQIQLYRTIFKGECVVIAKDNKYSNILEEQGVIFIKYPISQ